jgi:beta-glucanase (GH16 family)
VTGRLRVRTQSKVAAVALAVALAAGVVAVVLLHSHAEAVHGHPSSSGGCGPPLVKRDGTPWVCTFDDEFDGGSLSPVWTRVTTATTGFRGGQECNQASGVDVRDGLLVLTASRSPSPRACGRYTTDFDSGMVWTKGTFAQAYGRFEMRAKLPDGLGLQSAFWMLPANPRGTGRYEYGEIDIAEKWGNYPNFVDPHLHYVRTPDSPAGGAACKIADSAAAFHTYALEWTPVRMRFDYDGTTCWSTDWQPQAGYAPIGAQPPVPFDQPFYLILQLAVGGAKTPANVPTASTHFPVSMEVDYVRVWK